MNHCAHSRTSNWSILFNFVLFGYSIVTGVIAPFVCVAVHPVWAILLILSSDGIGGNGGSFNCFNSFASAQCGHRSTRTHRVNALDALSVILCFFFCLPSFNAPLPTTRSYIGSVNHFSTFHFQAEQAYYSLTMTSSPSTRCYLSWWP